MSLTTIIVPSDLTNDCASRCGLDLTEFELNSEVSRENFTLAALELPGGTRILDHRPETDSQRRILFNPLKDSELEVYLDRVAVQLKPLPNRPVRPAPVVPVNRSRLGRILLNAVGLMVIAAVLFGRRTRKPGTQSSTGT